MSKVKKGHKYIGLNLLTRREIRLLKSEIKFWESVLERDHLPYKARTIKAWIQSMKNELKWHNETRMKGAMTAK